MATYAERLAAINVQLDAAISSPKVNYTMGDISYNHGDYVDALMRMRESLLKTPEAEEVIETQAIGISAFGEDQSEEMV